MTRYFPEPMIGPLVPYAKGFRTVLTSHGYARSTAQQHVSLAGRLSRWLDLHGLDAEALTDAVLQLFLNDLAGEGGVHPTSASFRMLLSYLREQGLTPVPEPPPDPVPPTRVVLGRFEVYLLQERALSDGTVRNYSLGAGQFMDWLAGRSTTLDAMSGADVLTFITGIYQVQAAKSVKLLVTGLRSFLHWLYLEGFIGQSLAHAVPSAAAHGRSLPQGLSATELEALLASCDQAAAVGRRDYAVLVLMSRLGLRSLEVASLTLRDVDWRAGEITLRGKGRCEEKLPLPHDVGSAIAGYLRIGRLKTAGDSLFLRVRAPLGGLTSAGVSEIVLAAGKRAGLEGIHAHRLRHTAATQLLRAGASMADVGQVLRHRSPASTALYAKVDYAALRALALPWPGSGL